MKISRLLSAALVAAGIYPCISSGADSKIDSRDPSIFVYDRKANTVDGKEIKIEDDKYLASKEYDPNLSNKDNLKDHRVKKCSLVIENGPCYVVIGNDEPSLSSIRVNSVTGRVEVWVYRDPLEKVEFDSTTTLQLEPDVGAALMKQWLDPLKSLTLYTKAPYIHSSAAPLAGEILQEANLNVQCAVRLQSLCDLLDNVAALQTSTRRILKKWSEDVDTDSKSVAALKTIRWKLEDGTSVAAQSAVYTDLQEKLVAARTALGNAASKMPCEEGAQDDDNFVLIRPSNTPKPAPLPAAAERIPSARCRLPFDQASASHELLLLARAVFAGFTPDANVKGESGKFQRISYDLQKLVENQVLLESRLNDAKLAQEKLAAVGDKLKEVNFDSDLRPLAVKKVASPQANATTQIKITETNLWNAKATSIASPAIQWQYAKWELSAGIAISTLKKKTFGVAPSLDANGAPTLGSKIVSTSTSPSVFPIANAHYRLGDEKLRGIRRSATLLTLGIGANDGAAEAFGGVSRSYGGFYMTLGAHLGRVKKLGADLEVGETTTIAAGDLAKFEQKAWVVRPGFSFSYRVPVP